ncbi:MAG: thioredoxin family protein [Candidatus Zixiibacteriota bacterium]
MRLVLKNSLFLFLSVFMLMVMSCDKKAETKKKETSEQTQSVQKSEPVANTKSAAKSQNEQNLPKLLDLGAHKCKPCIKMAPILDELKIQYKGQFDVVFVDVWQPENKPIARKHGISSIPTQIFFDADGIELWRHVGFFSKADILNKWKELGYSFDEPNQKEKTGTKSASAGNE